MSNLDQDYEMKCKHFIFLKEKYQANNYEDNSPHSLLYLILRKTDLGLEISESELNWLAENKLTQVINLISMQKYRKGELKRLEAEFSQLKEKYNINRTWESSSSSFLYPILWKLDTQGDLDSQDIQLLRDHNLSQLIAILQDIKNFAALKEKYQATGYPDLLPDKILYPILKKLDKFQPLDNSEDEWLWENDLLETIEVSEQQKSERQAKFNQLKEKYQATEHLDVSTSSRLCEILQKLEDNRKLNYLDEDWLSQKGLTETLAIAKKLEQEREFTTLKVKYKAEKYPDTSVNSELYVILRKIESGENLSDSDLQFLADKELIDTLAIANEKYAISLQKKAALGNFLEDAEITWLSNHGYENIITFAEQKHFASLKRKYQIINPNLPIDPFYGIMLKLERKERLESLLVIKLIEKGMLSRDGEIARTHYRQEAEFFEKEYQRTGNKWNIPTASKFWRKANEIEQALKITNLDLGRIRENRLKSAILVTRGAAFRDDDQLDNAEKCAKQAMEYQPDTHQPYTLMGAICYDRYEYPEGDYWFEKAVEFGAEIKDIDAEIKQVIRNEKDEDKRHQAAEYLLNKDAQRYAWANNYLR
ncbi:hypothetical protein [Anabaena sp. UHCC 0451]|uniref:hypothetical protein n=1 Tax=Anabaena sp. UHCC 0451 TaxID=2055235 RepID=UPI002B2211A0|nr:hypothetical protein [Anabaena sp. UHCC 0451]MEA5578965.1 hypothetical protein [Anabaena sp. UHCC 0451]